MSVQQRLQQLVATATNLRELGWRRDNKNNWTNPDFLHFRILEKARNNFVVYCRGYRGPIKFTTNGKSAHDYVVRFKPQEDARPIHLRYGGAVNEVSDELRYKGLQNWVEQYIILRKAGKFDDAKNLRNKINHAINEYMLDSAEVWGENIQQ